MEGIMIAITTILSILSAVGLGVSCFLLYQNFRREHPKKVKTSFKKETDARLTSIEQFIKAMPVNFTTAEDYMRLGLRIKKLEDNVYGKEEKK